MSLLLGFTCSVVDSIRKPTKEKKPVADLMVVEVRKLYILGYARSQSNSLSTLSLPTQSWRALIGIVDGVVTAFDSQYSQSLGAVTEQKGSHCYSVNEQSRFLVLANKKKLYQYAWQAPGFVPIREYNLTDTPKSLLCVRNGVIIGYRKHYECLDLITGNATRILDVEREHKMLIAEVCVITLSVAVCAVLLLFVSFDSAYICLFLLVSYDNPDGWEQVSTGRFASLPGPARSRAGDGQGACRHILRVWLHFRGALGVGWSPCILFCAAAFHRVRTGRFGRDPRSGQFASPAAHHNLCAGPARAELLQQRGGAEQQQHTAVWLYLQRRGAQRVENDPHCQAGTSYSVCTLLGLLYCFLLFTFLLWTYGFQLSLFHSCLFAIIFYDYFRNVQ